MNRLGERIDFYRYGEQLKDHQCELDSMTKQSVLDLKLKGFGAESRSK